MTTAGAPPQGQAATLAEKVKNSSIDNVYLLTKIIQLIMAFVLILQATLRMFTADNFHFASHFTSSSSLWRLSALSAIVNELASGSTS